MNLAPPWFWSADNGNAGSLAVAFRAARFRRFADLLRDAPGAVRILDVGGTSATWKSYHRALPSSADVTLLNLEFPERPAVRGVSYDIGDARDLSRFPDRHFDLCFSNSLIEHVGTLDEQRVIANEIRRVARGYFVQTPNLFFPLEPHFLVPGWQFLPISLRSRLLRKWDLGWMKKTEDPVLARETVKSIRLMRKSEIRLLFPDGQIFCERIGPFTKSFIAFKRLSH